MGTPRWIRVLLEWIVPAERWDDVLGDLEEMHTRRVTRWGRRSAWLRSGLEGLLLAGTFLLYRWRCRRTGSTRRRSWFGSGVLTRTELSLALRLIRKQPVLSATVVMALAAGIGLAAGAFTFARSVVDGTLPVDNGDRFVRLVAYADPGGQRVAVGAERYVQLGERKDLFAYLGAIRGDHLNIRHASGEVEMVIGAYVTPGSFGVMAFRPLIGRSFGRHDGGPGAAPVVLIRESLWERRFARDPEVVGRRLNVAGIERTIVGVVPNAFEFPNSGEIWLPLDEHTLGSMTRSTPVSSVFGVLADNVSLELAREQVRQFAVHFDATVGGDALLRLDVRSFTDLSDDGIDQVLIVFMAMPIVVLLIVASNVANLIFARTMARSPELAVRTALGASRSRLVGQLFLEVLFLASLAGALGLVASHVVLGWVEASIEVDELPFWIDFSPTLSTIAFVVALTVLATAVGSMGPALRATRRDTSGTLHAGARVGQTRGVGWIGNVMIVMEMSMSVALLSAAGVLAWGFARYATDAVDLPRDVLTAQVYIATPSDSGAAPHARFLRAVERITNLASFGAATALPRMSPAVEPVIVESPSLRKPRPLTAPIVGVGPGFLETLGGRAIAGRLFDERDFSLEAAPVAVVNEPFVRKFFGGRTPLGERIRVVTSHADGEPPDWREVIGVVPDLGLMMGDEQLAAGYYVPMRQPNLFYVALRGEDDPTALAQSLRLAAYDVDPDIVVSRIVPLEVVGWEDRAAMRAFSTVLLGIGTAALVLSLTGMYAIMSFTVTRRTREIGIRVALGADRRQILGPVVRRAVALLAVGGVVGSLLAAAFVEMRHAILVTRLPDTGPWIFPAIVVLMAGSGLVACWVPARRAFGIRPMEALRQE